MTDTPNTSGPSAFPWKRYTFHSLPDSHSEDGRWVEHSAALAALARAREEARREALEEAAAVAKAAAAVNRESRDLAGSSCDYQQASDFEVALAESLEIERDIRALIHPTPQGETKEQQP